MMLKASLENKVKGYIPYEAGRKIPISERVAHYMKKLEQQEEGEKTLANLKQQETAGGKRLQTRNLENRGMSIKEVDESQQSYTMSE